MRSKPAVILISIATVVATSSASAVAADASPPGSAGTTAAGTSPESGFRSRTLITLPTGDRVDVFTDAAGRTTAGVAEPRPGSAPFHSFRVGSHFYVIPRSAAPKIGPALRLSQFDVTAPGTPIVTPNFPMHTLTINGINSNGGPSEDADIVVANVDDVRKFFSYQFFTKGLVKMSLPGGHYIANSVSLTYSPSGRTTARVVSLPQFTVAGDSTLTVDARSANSRVTVKTPRPAASQGYEVQLDRTDTRGVTFSEDLTTNAGDLVYVSPTPAAVTLGQLHYSIYTRSDGADDSYVYDTQVVNDGAIPSNNRYITTAAQYATITARYYAEVPRAGLETRFSFLPWQDSGSRYFMDKPQPSRRTEYVTANPDIIWRQVVLAVNFDVGFFVGALEDSERSYSTGERSTMEWNKQPMHPGVVVDAGPNLLNEFLCPVCRAGDHLGLGIDPFADNTPGHAGLFDEPIEGLTESGALQLYRNGTPLDPDPDTGLYPLTPSPANYRIVADTVRKSAFWTLSTQTHTVWTFRSAHADGSGSLPDGWRCDGGGRNCAVVPLMMARYDVPLSLSDKNAAGATTIGLTVDHLQGGPALPVTAAGVSVSYDDGASWLPTTTESLGGGHFKVSYTTPAKAATNGYVAIRVTATDAAGGTFTQSVVRAYALS